MNKLDTPVSQLHGVGQKRTALYEKLGIETVYQLLCHFPRSYRDYTSPVDVKDAPFDENAVIKAKIVRKMNVQYIRKGLTLYKAIATDGETDFVITIYNNMYAFDAIHIGKEYRFYGKLGGTLLRREMSSPKIIDENAEPIQPHYHLTDGLTDAMIYTNMKEALLMVSEEIHEFLPFWIVANYGLMPLSEAFENIHFPSDMDKLNSATRRLAFDELLTLQLGMSLMKSQNCTQTGCVMQEKGIEDFYDAVPFELTNAQKRAVGEICDDMCKAVPMNRLLQGDVGSGKTAVAAAACCFAHKNGYQSALMAPTEILASQHYDTLKSLLEPLGISVCLLCGSLTQKQKNAVKVDIVEGKYSVIVGTHAIIQKTTVFKNLGLVITDEQHRFGVAQRSALAGKGEFPHKLVMSATPIPRTLALIIYGDLDISVLNELPKGRLKIETYAVTGKMRERAYGFIRKCINEGHQAYIVCPAIEDNGNDLQAVCDYAKRLAETEFEYYPVGLLHGKMPASEKDEVMEKFRQGKIHLLVSTTVIEVGVDVPNAIVMMIENSERFGLSQLHQLRGRVGRGGVQSYCILVTDKVTEEVRHRLKVMSSTSDGFKISEEDLKLRGPGDFFGEKQHGLPDLKVADMASDMTIMADTSEAAKKLLEIDARLSWDENHALYERIKYLFEKENAFN